MMTKSQKHRLGAGFTLIELLVVMAIIAVLTAISFGNFINSQKKSRDAKRKGDLRNITTALEAYLNDYGVYPRSDSNGYILACGTSSSPTACNWGSTFKHSDKDMLYMTELPQDPGQYQYRYQSTDGSEYTLYARLENDRDPDINSGLSQTCGSVTCNYVISSSNHQP